MGCFDDAGYGSQEGLEEYYRRMQADSVQMYLAYSPDRSKHYTLLLDSNDNTVGLVLPGKDEVEEWYSQDEVDALFEYRPLEAILSQVPQGYSLEDARGALVTRELLLGAANMLSKL